MLAAVAVIRLWMTKVVEKRPSGRQQLLNLGWLCDALVLVKLLPNSQAQCSPILKALCPINCASETLPVQITDCLCMAALHCLPQPMFSIVPFLYFERQEGLLCGKHCLNNLLQGEYFSEVDLANIAASLDRSENALLETRQRQSQNMDDTGFFSVQVLQKALSNFGIAMEPSPISKAEKAFIVNYKEHWFAVRKFMNSFYDLNSLFEAPQTADLNDYSSPFHFVYAVRGTLPQCLADKKAEEEEILDALAKRPVDIDLVRQQRLARFK